jgi:hypothetical protein
MRVIIAGSRDITSHELVWPLIASSKFPITEVVSVAQRGVDRLGELYARAHSLGCNRVPAKWSRYGPAAGPIRNAEMADYADAAIVIHNNSPGSLDMVEQMRMRGKPVEEHVLDEPM